MSYLIVAGICLLVGFGGGIAFWKHRQQFKDKAQAELFGKKG